MVLFHSVKCHFNQTSACFSKMHTRTKGGKEWTYKRTKQQLYLSMSSLTVDLKMTLWCKLTNSCVTQMLFLCSLVTRTLLALITSSMSHLLSIVRLRQRRNTVPLKYKYVKFNFRLIYDFYILFLRYLILSGKSNSQLLDWYICPLLWMFQ